MKTRSPPQGLTFEQACSAFSCTPPRSWVLVAWWQGRVGVCPDTISRYGHPPFGSRDVRRSVSADANSLTIRQWLCSPLQLVCLFGRLPSKSPHRQSRFRSRRNRGQSRVVTSQVLKRRSCSSTLVNRRLAHWYIKFTYGNSQTNNYVVEFYNHGSGTQMFNFLNSV